MEQPSATTIVMEVMEEFGDSEPEHFLAIWTNRDGDIVIKTNTKKMIAIGLAEYAKQWIIAACAFSQ